MKGLRETIKQIIKQQKQYIPSVQEIVNYRFQQAMMYTFVKQ